MKKQKAVLTYLAVQAEGKNLAQLKETFLKFDQKNDGTLNYDDFMRCLSFNFMKGREYEIEETKKELKCWDD